MRRLTFIDDVFSVHPRIHDDKHAGMSDELSGGGANADDGFSHDADHFLRASVDGNEPSDHVLSAVSVVDTRPESTV